MRTKTIILAMAIGLLNYQNIEAKQNNIKPINGGIVNSQERESIEIVLKDYFNALNNSSVSEALAQYSADGVFMPQEAPTSTGHKQLKAAYEHVFNTLDFINMGFTIDEITIENNFAIVRTSSLGNLKILANNMIIEGAKHRELFVMQKINGDWKIARYMFNTTAPAQH